MGAYCAIAVVALLAVLVARKHRVGQQGQAVGLASGVIGLVLVAVMVSPAALLPVLGGAIGAAVAGAGLGLALSETTRMVRTGVR